MSKEGLLELSPITLDDIGVLRDVIDSETAIPGYGAQKIVGHQTLMRYSRFVDFVLDPKLIDECAHYFGIEPTLQLTLGWRNQYDSFGKADLRGDFSWHFDLHGHIFLKYFVYLSDVTHEDGPHEYLPRTHRVHVGGLGSHLKLSETTRMTILRKLNAAESGMNKSVILQDDDLHELMPLKRTILGPVGTRFLEDTRGLHRGTSIKRTNGTRYLFQALFVPYASNNNDLPIRANLNFDLIQERLGEKYSSAQLRKIFGFAFNLC